MSLGTAAAGASLSALTVATANPPLPVTATTVAHSSALPTSNVSSLTAQPHTDAAASAAARAAATDLTLSSPENDTAPAAAAAAASSWIPAPLSRFDTQSAKKAARAFQLTGRTDPSLSATVQSALSAFLPPPFIAAPQYAAAATMNAAAATPAPIVSSAAVSMDIEPFTAAAAPAAAAATSAARPPAHTAQAQSYLTDFCQSTRVQDMLREAKQSFLNADRDLKQARIQRDRFVAKCRRDGSPTVTLPGNLRLNLVKNSRFDSSKDQPAFAKESLDAMLALENATSKAAFDILCAAKAKWIAHLEERSNAAVHIAHHKALFVKVVRDYATRIDKKLSPAVAAASASASSIFPVAAAIDFFHQSITATINACVFAQIEADIAADAKKESARAAEFTAQEAVLAGAHNGKTIAKIAVREIEKRIVPLQQSVVDMQNWREPHTSVAARHLSTSPSASTSQRSSSLAAKQKRTPAQHPRHASAAAPIFEFEFGPELIAQPAAAASAASRLDRKRKTSSGQIADDSDDAAASSSIAGPNSSSHRRPKHQDSNSRGGTPAARSPARSSRDNAESESPVMEQ